MNQTSSFVLAGFMASGKTVVAKSLGRRLGCATVDLDQVLCKDAGRSIARMIEEWGEPLFRVCETNTLRKVLQNNSAGVIALGGGAWIREENRALIAARSCYTVWIDAPFDLCWQRISSSDPTERPLARDRASAKHLFDERRPVYAQAMLRVAIANRTSAEEVANEILTRCAGLERVRLTETMTLAEFSVVSENA